MRYVAIDVFVTGCIDFLSRISIVSLIKYFVINLGSLPWKWKCPWTCFIHCMCWSS